MATLLPVDAIFINGGWGKKNKLKNCFLKNLLMEKQKSFKADFMVMTYTLEFISCKKFHQV